MDDVPSKDFKQKIDFLYEKSIQAICFCVGKYMLGHEEDLIYAIKKGFILGNHSFNHIHFSDMSLEECKEAINKSEALIEAVYKKANIKRPAKFFRFPFFDQGGNANCLDTVDVLLIHDHEKNTELFYKIINRYVEKKFEFLRYY